MFINLYELARSAGEDKIYEFTRDVLRLYEYHDVNGHIAWREH